MPPLTHYTKSLAAVVNIVENGFMWYPNARRLAELLIPGYAFSHREPQQFGMVSFTELAPNEAARHQLTFGEFGIVVTESWALRHRAQRVYYVPNSGPVPEALRDLYLAGAEDLANRIQYPDDTWWLSSFENRAMADMVGGARLWSRLLTLWEYMEPEESQAQREWRIVNPEADYSNFGTKAEAIAAVSPPKNWGKFTRVLVATPEDLAGFVCPRSRVQELRQALPSRLQNHPIAETDA